jgi:hypothetical protein
MAMLIARVIGDGALTSPHQRNDASTTAAARALGGLAPGGRRRSPDLRCAHGARAEHRVRPTLCGCSPSASRSPPPGSWSLAARFPEEPVAFVLNPPQVCSKRCDALVTRFQHLSVLFFGSSAKTHRPSAMNRAMRAGHASTRVRAKRPFACQRRRPERQRGQPPPLPQSSCARPTTATSATSGCKERLLHFARIDVRPAADGDPGSP